MAILAALIGMVSVGLGLSASLQIDTPSGPSIVIVAVMFFFAANILPQKK
jgi:zinc transport system permease protein